MDRDGRLLRPQLDWLQVVHLRTALGAFPGSPIHAGLRVDVTGHALLALLALLATKGR